MKPIVMIILDGAADISECRDYHLSPLAAANMPGLDNLGHIGHAGLLYPIAEGIEPETHSGMLNLLGYPVLPHEVPRGPIEGLGCGMHVEDGDLVLRANFGTQDETTGLITDRRVCRTLRIDEASQLCQDIVEYVRKTTTNYHLDMRAVRDYRACAVIHSDTMHLSDEISNTDPGYPTEGLHVQAQGGFQPILCKALTQTVSALQTASIVNDFVSKAEGVLLSHPSNQRRKKAGLPLANAILTRGPGCSLPRLENISSRFGLPFTLLADLPIERGVGVLVGCKCLSYEPLTARSRTYLSLTEEIKKLALSDTVTVVHIKGPDEYGHDGDYTGKVKCLEDIDHFLITPLTQSMLQDAIWVVTSDHATPCFAHTHTSDPVPFVVAGPNIAVNGAERITEYACSRLHSPIAKGSQLLSFVVDLARG